MNTGFPLPSFWALFYLVSTIVCILILKHHKELMQSIKLSKSKAFIYGKEDKEREKDGLFKKGFFQVVSKKVGWKKKKFFLFHEKWFESDEPLFFKDNENLVLQQLPTKNTIDPSLHIEKISIEGEPFVLVEITNENKHCLSNSISMTEEDLVLNDYGIICLKKEKTNNIKCVDLSGVVIFSEQNGKPLFVYKKDGFYKINHSDL